LRCDVASKAHFLVFGSAASKRGAQHHDSQNTHVLIPQAQPYPSATCGRGQRVFRWWPHFCARLSFLNVSAVPDITTAEGCCSSLFSFRLPQWVFLREGVEHPIDVTTRLSVVRLPFGFKVWRGVRHPEKDHNLPAWLALKCATILFHRLGADRAQRGHWAKGLSRQTLIPACRRNTVQICVIRSHSAVHRRGHRTIR
jgi:hypothetical protein